MRRRTRLDGRYAGCPVRRTGMPGPLAVTARPAARTHRAGAGRLTCLALTCAGEDR